MKNLVLNECSILAHTLRCLSLFFCLSLSVARLHMQLMMGKRLQRERGRKEICMCVCGAGFAVRELAAEGAGGGSVAMVVTRGRRGGRKGGREERERRASAAPSLWLFCLLWVFSFPRPRRKRPVARVPVPKAAARALFFIFLPDLPDLPFVVVFFFSSFSPSFLFAFFSSFFYLSWDLPIFSFRPLFHSVTHCQTTRPPSLGTPTTFS